MLLTRLELFLRRTGLKPMDVARAALYSRQHVLRVRLGQAGETRRFILALTAACRALSGEAVTPAMLFERADALLSSPGQRLSRVHAADLRRLAALLEDVAAPHWLTLVRNSGIATETAVRYLLRHGHARIDVHPTAAAAIFSAALEMAAALADTPFELVASLQGHALKGRANALRHFGRYEQALADLSGAARLFGRARYCVVDAAQTDYARGVVLFNMERWEEALTVVRAARRKFFAAGDARRTAHADLLEAAILFDQGNIEAARETWLRLATTLTALGDREAVARVFQNLGACEIRRGRRQESRYWLNRASAAFRELGNRTELARTRWNMATYIATFRDRRLGIHALARVERSFMNLGLLVDAGCVGLEIVEMMIEDGPDKALTRRAQDVAGVLVRAGLGASAATALDQLRRIAAANNRRDVVRQVRSALREFDSPCGPSWRESAEAADIRDLGGD